MNELRKKVWNYLKENDEAPCSELYEIFGRKAQIGLHYGQFFEARDYFLEIMEQYNEGKWRIAVLKRDNFTCQLCGYKPSRVAHHINSRNYYPNLKWDIDNGLTVCDNCHKKYHRGNNNAET